MRFPYCEACRKAPGKLCAGHGASLSNPQPGKPAEETAP